MTGTRTRTTSVITGQRRLYLIGGLDELLNTAHGEGYTEIEALLEAVKAGGIEIPEAGRAEGE